MKTNSMCNKTIIFINDHKTSEQSRHSHSPHASFLRDILNGTGHLQLGAGGK